MWLLMHPISNCFSFTSFFACGVSVTLLKAVIDEQRKIWFALIRSIGLFEKTFQYFFAKVNL